MSVIPLVLCAFGSLVMWLSNVWELGTLLFSENMLITIQSVFCCAQIHMYTQAKILHLQTADVYFISAVQDPVSAHS